MGNYSYLCNQEGCILDVATLKRELAKKPKGVQDYLDFGGGKKLLEENLGEFMDGWKIQGYWYEAFIDFLFCCARSMPNLTNRQGDNYIEMDEEQGFKFFIFFLLRDGKPDVCVDYVPMEFLTMKLEEKFPIKSLSKAELTADLKAEKITIEAFRREVKKDEVNGSRKK